jgi:hypothetical protein
MAITVSQVAPIDARAGFSQSISVAYGQGLAGTSSYGLPASLGGSSESTADTPQEDTSPNWWLIAAAVLVFYYLLK